MPSKKGIVEVQFNWIFVLIAGALILALVVGFASKWMATSTRKDAIKSLGNLETVITATGVVEGESRVDAFPNLQLTYDCHELRMRGVSASGLSATSVFAPPLIKGNSLVHWTEAWYVPFFAGNFVFLTSPQVKYDIVYNPGNKASVMLKNYTQRTLPENVNVEFSPEQDFNDENYYYYVFVYLGVPPIPPPNFGGELRAVQVSLNPDNISGSLGFYESDSGSWVPTGASSWVLPELMLGGIVAGDFDIYSCIKAQALKRVEIMSALLLQRINLIEGDNEDKYGPAKEVLNTIHASAINKQLSARDVKELEWQNTILSYEAEPQVY